MRWQRRWASKQVWLTWGPALLLTVLASLRPAQGLLLVGAACGWVIVAQVIVRNRAQMKYQAAIRSMRQGEYQEAIRIMNALINAEPDSLEHHRFRAELYWLHGDLQRAAADFQWMTRRAAGRVSGTIGLAELAMQQGDLDRARDHALAALERDNGWRAAYDLGWIEDRRFDAEAAVEALERALASGIPESRYRLLARLWLARNYHRLGRDEDARKQIALMRKETKGARDWQAIFESEQGIVLREMFEEEVHLAQQLLEAEVTLEALD